MASGLYTAGLHEIISGGINLGTDTFKIMLVDDTYTYNADHEFVDDGSADDPASHEVSATNYAGGFAGSGRKTATITSQANDTDNRVELAIADLTWSAIGGVSNDTIGGLVLYRHVTDDASSHLIAFFDITDTPTNGGDITFDFLALGAGGNIRVTV